MTIVENAGTTLNITTGKTLAVTNDATVSGTNTGDQLYTASGDATAPSSASNLALTLATVTTADTTGGSTAIPVITKNIKGLVTSITTAAVIAPAGTLTGATDELEIATEANVSGAVVTITARHKGAAGNEIDVRYNYQDGEELPEGVTLAIVDLASGATNPTLTSLISALGDERYHVIAFPYTDATSLTAIENELSSRFGPMRMIDGVAFAAKDTSHASLTTLGDGRNSPHVSIIAVNDSPTPPFEYAAHVAATVAFYGNIDPARPFQTLPLPWVKAPAEADRYTVEERNLLLYDGISTTKVGAGGLVQIERLITTYQENAAAAADTAYLDVTTMLTLLYLRFSFRNGVSTTFPRHKVADDGTRFGAGQAVVTPKIMKAYAVAWFDQMEELGLVENAAQFKADLVVERNESDPNRMDILLPPDLINQLIVTGVNLQFRL